MAKFKKDRDYKVIEALEDGPKRWTKIKEITKLTDQTVSRSLNTLQKLEMIIYSNPLYALPRDKEELERETGERLPEELSDIDDDIVREARKEHMENFRSILKQMKDIAENSRIVISEEKNLAEIDSDFRSDSWKLQHLRKHVPKLIEKWDEYFNRIDRLSEARNNLKNLNLQRTREYIEKVGGLPEEEEDIPLFTQEVINHYRAERKALEDTEKTENDKKILNFLVKYAKIYETLHENRKELIERLDRLVNSATLPRYCDMLVEELKK